ncbi:Uu.00g008020.m01.CDS01 [Anthostomella pinea]|uniref:Uu.00g008020.m01.CDS01 n=1 Tax=Anthostomella pinea TaxID=933095 RepID=A0AAI8VX49_9PEZI|nr:Uu.00g008020.m01.CDS01 [Anthostomella pinea]
MPTPSSNPPPELPPRSHSSSCPDEVRNPSSWRPDQDALETDVDGNEMTSPEPVSAPPSEMVEGTTDSRSASESPRPDSRSDTEATTTEHIDSSTPSYKPTDIDDDDGLARERLGDTHTSSTQRHSAGYDIMSATGADNDKMEDCVMPGRSPDDSYAPSMGYKFSNVRIMPTSSSSYLRPGSRFHGTQQSERQVYDVQVEIKYVDLRESFLCGYLKIKGLTPDNPTLTTYFESEIIGSKYGFITKHDDWGASEKIDLNHWGKFSAFRQYKNQLRKGPVSIPNLAQRENIFMRWKEHFLVPDHRVTTINGASFEGFYYICFNQKEGSVNGIYFHSKSEKFQQLELKHVEDRGCFSAIEFR